MCACPCSGRSLPPQSNNPDSCPAPGSRGGPGAGGGAPGAGGGGPGGRGGARPKSVERVAPNLAADSSAINAVREALEEEVALEEKVVALEEEMALEVVVVPEAEMLPMAVVEAEEDLLG